MISPQPPQTTSSKAIKPRPGLKQHQNLKQRQQRQIHKQHTKNKTQTQTSSRTNTCLQNEQCPILLPNDFSPFSAQVTLRPAPSTRGRATSAWGAEVLLCSALALRKTKGAQKEIEIWKKDYALLWKASSKKSVFLSVWLVLDHL